MEFCLLSFFPIPTLRDQLLNTKKNNEFPHSISPHPRLLRQVERYNRTGRHSCNRSTFPRKLKFTSEFISTTWARRIILTAKFDEALMRQLQESPVSYRSGKFGDVIIPYDEVMLRPVAEHVPAQEPAWKITIMGISSCFWAFRRNAWMRKKLRQWLGNGMKSVS